MVHKPCRYISMLGDPSWYGSRLVHVKQLHHLRGTAASVASAATALQSRCVFTVCYRTPGPFIHHAQSNFFLQSHAGIPCLNPVLHVLCVTVPKDLILCTIDIRCLTWRPQGHIMMDHPKYVTHNKQISTHNTGQIILPYIVTGAGTMFVT